jgi:hypothetical protein
MRMLKWSVALSSLVVLSAAIVGCSGAGSNSSAGSGSGTGTGGSTGGSGSLSGVGISGKVMSGSVAVSSAHVYLLAARTNTYGGSGLAASTSNASISLETAGGGATLDSATGPTNGFYYTTTDSNGNFSIPAGYSCFPSNQLYLYTSGGNAGGGANSSLSLMAVIGGCQSSASATTVPVVVNEVTTVAAAFASAGFATDPLHIATSSSAQASRGLQNGFITATYLASSTTGAAVLTPPPTGFLAPQAAVNTLADALTACANSSGSVAGPSSATPCYVLFSSALASGTSGAQPADTATAAINIAHFPAVAPAALYALANTTPTYSPALKAQPASFALVLTTSAAFNAATAIAIDSSGDAWVTDSSNLYEVAVAGAASPGTRVFTSVGIAKPSGIAIDQSNNIWIANQTGSTVSELSSTGTPLSGSPFSIGSGQANGIAFDTLGNAWIADSNSTLVQLTSSGVQATGSPFSGGGLSSPVAVALDASGHVWTGNAGSVSEFSISGTPASGSPFQGSLVGSLLQNVHSLAIDSSGNVWAAGTNLGVTKLSSTGSVSASSPFADAQGVAVDGANNVWVGGQSGTLSALTSSGTLFSQASLVGSGVAVAVDGSGNVWYLTQTGLGIDVGAAAPVATPLSLSLKNGELGSRP